MRSHVSVRAKWALGIALVSGVASYCVAEKNLDLRENDMAALEEAADDVLVDPHATLLNRITKTKLDQRVDLHSPKLIKLLQLTKATKALIEQDSEDRSSLDESDPRLASHFKIATRYFGVQNRLYVNYLRNAHALTKPGTDIGLKFHRDEYDFLNLHLSPQAGAVAAINGDELKTSLFHVKNKDGTYHIEIGSSEQMKTTQEEIALKMDSSENHYGKLILLNSIRERAGNFWALQRMNSFQFIDPKMQSCGNDLLSFRSPTYYSSFSNMDRYNAYPQMANDIAEFMIRPLLTSEQMNALLHRYFNYWAPFRKDMTDFADDVYYDKASAAIVTLVNSAIDDKKKAMITDANLPGDSGDPKEVAERLTYEALLVQKREIIARMMDRLDEVALMAGTKEFVKTLPNAKLVAAKMLEEQVGLAIYDWRDGMTNQIRQYLTSSKVTDLRNLNAAQYFEAHLKKLEPAYQEATHAYKVNETIDAYVKNHNEAFKQEAGIGQFHAEESSLSSAKNTLAYIPSAPYFKSDVSLQDPDALSLYYYKKLASFASISTSLSKIVVPFIEVKLAEMSLSDEQKVAITQAGQIASNQMVTEGVRHFFSTLSEAQQKEMDKAKKAAEAAHQANPNAPAMDLPSSQAVMAKVLKKAAHDAYEDFLDRSESVNASKKRPVRAMPADPKEEDDKADCKLVTLDQLKAQDYQQPLKEVTITASRSGSKPAATKLVKAATQKPIAKKLTAAEQKSAHYDAILKKALKAPTKAMQQDHVARVNLVPKTNSLFTQSKVEQENVRRLYLMAMSLMGLAFELEPKLHFNAPRTHAGTVQEKVGGLIEIEAYLRKRSPMKSPTDALLMSVADQKIAAQVVIEKALTRVPLLATQIDFNPKSDPLYLLLMKRGENTKKESFRANLMSYMQTALLKQGKLVEEVCSAMPFENNNEAFRKVFHVSTTYRKELKMADERYVAMDQHWMGVTQTQMESALQFLDPVVQGLFLASMIYLAISFAPLLIASAAGYVGVGSAAAGITGGAAGVSQTFGFALIKTSIAGLIMEHGLFHMTLSGLFALQTLTMGYVNFIELPQEFQYQLGVQNSDVGIFGKTPTNREALNEFANQMHAGQVNAVMLAAMNLGGPIYSGGKAIVNGVKSLERATGVRGFKAVQGFSKNAESAEIMKEIGTKSREDYVKEYGEIEGLKQFRKDVLNRVKNKEAPFPIFTDKANIKSINEVMSIRMSDTLSLEETRKLYVVSLSRQMQEARALFRESKEAMMIEQRQATRAARAQTAAPESRGFKEAFQNGIKNVRDYKNSYNATMGNLKEYARELRSSIKNKAASHIDGEFEARIKEESSSFNREHTVDSEDFFGKIKTEEKPTGWEPVQLISGYTPAEYRALLIYQQIGGLADQLEHDAMMFQKLNLFIKGSNGRETASELSRQFFGTFSEIDWLKFERLIKSFNKDVSPSPVLTELRSSFKHYHYLMDELQRVHPENVPLPKNEERDFTHNEFSDINLNGQKFAPTESTSAKNPFRKTQPKPNLVYDEATGKWVPEASKTNQEN